MFTLKTRSYNLSPKQEAAGYPCYDEVESICGPFGAVSKETCKDTGSIVIYGLTEGGGIVHTVGPYEVCDRGVPAPPRPTVWVMNGSGATVAKYDL